MGFDKERLAAFTDGVFAVAITLLVVDVATKVDPIVNKIETSGWEGWKDLTGKTGLFALSFVIVGLYWIAHHNEYAMLHDVKNRWAIWLNVLFTLPIVLLPLPLAMVGSATTEEIRQKSLGLYMLNLSLAGFLLAWFFHCAAGKDNSHIKAGKKHNVTKTHKRNLIPAVTYLAFGLLTFFSVIPANASLSVVLLVPLIYLLMQAKDGWHSFPAGSD
jgi:uncharacterized membrane protein